MYKFGEAVLLANLSQKRELMKELRFLQVHYSMVPKHVQGLMESYGYDTLEPNGSIFRNGFLDLLPTCVESSCSPDGSVPEVLKGVKTIIDRLLPKES